MDARIRRVTALAALIGIVLIGAAGAQAEPTVKGDAAAWDEVATAFKKLDALSAYRLKMTTNRTTTMMEIVPLHAFHSVIQTASGTLELINVNGQGRNKSTGGNQPGRWQCVTGPPPDFSHIVGSIEGTVDVSRAPDTTIEGTPVRAYEYLYTFLQSGQTKTAKNITYVGTETGLPLRNLTFSPAGEVIFTADYYDYGAKIEITLPPCG